MSLDDPADSGTPILQMSDSPLPRAADLFWEQFTTDPPWGWALRKLGMRQFDYSTWRWPDGSEARIVGEGWGSFLEFDGAQPLEWMCDRLVVEHLFDGDRDRASRELMSRVLDPGCASPLPARLRQRVVEHWTRSGISRQALHELMGAPQSEDMGDSPPAERNTAVAAAPELEARKQDQGLIRPPVVAEGVCLVCAGADATCVVCGDPEPGLPPDPASPGATPLPPSSGGVEQTPAPSSELVARSTAESLELATPRADVELAPATEFVAGPPTAVSPKSGLEVLSRPDLDRLPRPTYAVQGVLPERGVAGLVGGFGSGKSLLILSLVASLSSGTEWNGRQVQRRGALMISLEGFHALPERVRAYELAHGRLLDEMHWIRQGVDLKKPADVDKVLAAARSVGATVVVVDSARAAGAGAEDTADMGRFMAGLERIRREIDGLVVVLHNTGWDMTRERGSTVFPDVCDVVLLLEKGKNGHRR